MTKFITLLTFLLVGAGLSSAVAQSDPGVERKKYLRPKKDDECQYVHNVTKNTEADQEVEGTFTRLAYRPYAELLTEIDALRKMNNWADSTYQRRYNALPPGGALVVTMHRKGAKNADPALLTVSARTKDGRELLSQQLAPGTGRFWNRDLYLSTRVIPFVKADAGQDILVTISDEKLQQKFEYVIEPQ